MSSSSTVQSSQQILNSSQTEKKNDRCASVSFTSSQHVHQPLPKRPSSSKVYISFYIDSHQTVCTIVKMGVWISFILHTLWFFNFLGSPFSLEGKSILNIFLAFPLHILSFESWIFTEKFQWEMSSTFWQKGHTTSKTILSKKTFLV